MKELFLIRHGQSEHHVNGYTGGWTDLPLTPKGREQARRTMLYLRHVLKASTQRVLCSDLLRARDTGEILAAGLGVAIEFSPALRELNNGVARGMLEAEAMRLKLPRTLPELDWVPFPEAESWRMMFRRLASYLDEVESRQTGPLVIVSHANALVCIINWWLRLTDDRSLQDLMYETDPCSVTHLRIDRHGCRSIDRLNDTSHLFAWPEGCVP